MGKRTYESDIIAMALLYRKGCIGTDMLSHDKALEFDLIINDNLDNMKSTCGIGLRCEQSSDLYRLLQEENGNVYAVINQNADLKKAWKCHVGCLPTDVIIASQKQNALETIGLKSIDDKIITQEKQKVKKCFREEKTKPFIDQLYQANFTAYDFMSLFCAINAIQNKYSFYRADLLNFIKDCKTKEEYSSLLDDINLKSNGVAEYSHDLEEATTKLKFGGILFTISPEKDSKIHILETIPVLDMLKRRTNHLNDMIDFVEEFNQYTLENRENNQSKQFVKK